MAELDGQLCQQEREDKGGDGWQTRGFHNRNGSHGDGQDQQAGQQVVGDCCRQ
ncbi:MAG TPA: hypothetical protein VK499_00840 [Propionibacteriaceae bacterium]|nr:hypothetical protein [Propionibacteriaceae bacterium]